MNPHMMRKTDPTTTMKPTNGDGSNMNPHYGYYMRKTDATTP